MHHLHTEVLGSTRISGKTESAVANIAWPASCGSTASGRRELVLDAMWIAVWRRRPTHPVIVHSDQGSQYGSGDAVRFCKDHGLIPSMSRRGDCFDNAVAESFFSSLKNERIRRRIYPSREEARADVLDYIEVFYNRYPPAQSQRSSQSARLRTGSPNTGLMGVYRTGGSPSLSGERFPGNLHSRVWT
jgi:hypothetical protein